MITLQRVTKSFSNERETLVILREVNLEVGKGEIISIVGPSGSGKSTLLSLMAGLDLPTSGRIVVDETDLTRLSVEEVTKFRGRRMGFVFQSFHLIPSLTALENVMVPLEIARHRDPEPAAREALERVGLEDRFSHRPVQLSGGEQQRVAIARALAPSPAILFVDEPTGSLDTKTGDLVADLLFDVCRESRVTMILVTHMPSLAERADKVYEMIHGNLQLAKQAKKAK